MGQVCFASEENEQRIQELENLLRDQEKEKAALKERLEEQRERQKKYKKSKSSRNGDGGRSDSNAEKIEQLTNEKKQVFKTMLKERKNVSKLEDQIQDYKNTISEMESKMQQLKDEKRKAQKRAEEAQRENSKSKSKDSRKGSSEKPKPKPKQEFTIGQPTTAGIKITNYVEELGLENNKSAPARNRGDSHKLQVGNKSSKGYTSASDAGMTSDSEYRGGATTTDNESTDGENTDALESKTTEILDVDYDPETEATHVYSWLHGQS